MSQQPEAEAEMDQESDDENDMKQQVEAELDDEEDEIEKDRSAKKDKVRRRNVKRFVDVHYRQQQKRKISPRKRGEKASGSVQTKTAGRGRAGKTLDSNDIQPRRKDGRVYRDPPPPPGHRIRSGGMYFTLLSVRNFSVFHHTII